MDTETEKSQEVGPAKQDDNRNPDGTFKDGISGNPLGRPRGKTLKEYARDYYMLKTDAEKKDYIEDLEKKKPGFAWTMAEGNPMTNTDITSGGESLQPILVKFLDGKPNNNRDSE